MGCFGNQRFAAGSIYHQCTVAPTVIFFPYRECESEGMNLPQIQQEIQKRLPTVIQIPGGTFI